MILDTLREYIIYYLFEVVLVSYYGWVLLVALLIWIKYRVTLIDNNNRFVESTKWVFLEVKVDELSEKSPLAMEQIFAALHAIHTNFTWGEILAGKTVLWVSCEIVSLGGRVSFVFRMPERYRNLFESAVFAQYPKAEITEVEDYLKNLKHYDTDETVDYEFWGTQMNKKKPNVYPIKSFKDFEHKEQETFIDPLSNVLEVMSNIQPYELMVSQMVIRPINEDWKSHARHEIDKLKGAPSHDTLPLFDKIIFGWPAAFFNLISGFFEEASVHAEEKHNDAPPSQMLFKTDEEKRVILALEHALSKIHFEVKVRLLYLAPKGKFNKGLRIPEIIGAYRNFEDTLLNNMKPDLGHTWTDVPYKISQTLEGPILKRRILERKRHFMHAFLNRSVWRGSGETYMNPEELATWFHFPVAPNVRVSQLQKVESVKSAPPANLPISVG